MDVILFSLQHLKILIAISPLLQHINLLIGLLNDGERSFSGSHSPFTKSSLPGGIAYIATEALGFFPLNIPKKFLLKNKFDCD